MDLGVDELAERIASEDRLFVMYWASWCGYCRRFLPHYERFAEQSPAPAVGADLHDDDDPRWEEADVHIVPTVVYYEDGQEVARLRGMAGLGIQPRKFEEFASRQLGGIRSG